MALKKILLVSSGGVERGGVSIFLRDWVKYAPKDRYEFTWCTPASNKDDALAEELRNEGAKLILGGAASGENPLGRAIHLAGALERVLAAERFDIVHVNTASISTNAVALSLAKHFGVPQRISHSHNAPQRISVLKRTANIMLRPRLLRSATRLATCSHLAAEYLFGKSAAGRALVVNNCIDTKRFAFSETVRQKYRRKLGVQDCFVIGHVGRFNTQKNHAFLLKVFQAVARKNERSRLLLVGDGELRPEIERQTAEFGLQDKVIFAGVTDAVQDYMCAMDVFVLPSLYEGFPIVGIEAQTSGLSCVFSASITAETQLRDGCTFVSLDDPPEAWAEKLLHAPMASNKDRAEAQRELMEKGFDVANIPRMVSELYEK